MKMQLSVRIKALSVQSLVSYRAPLTWALITAMVLLPAVIGAAEDDHAHAHAADCEPTVNRQEAALLKQLQALSRSDLAKAIRDLRSAIKEDSSPALTFALGSLEREAGRPELAMNAFRTALKAMPNFHRARESLAIVCLQQKQYTVAAQELATLLEGNAPEKGRLWKLLGYAYLTAGQTVAAEGAYRNALAYRAADREVRMGLIKSLLDQEALHRAKTLIRADLANDPSREDLWLLMANVELDAGRNEEALVWLECARRLGVSGGETLTTLGDLYLEENMLKEAMDVFGACAALEDPPVSRLLRIAEALVAQGQTEEAASLLGKLESAVRPLSPENQKTRDSVKAQLAMARGHIEEGLKIYKRLLTENPLDGEILMAAGKVHMERGAHDEALRHFQRATRVSPRHKARALVRQAQITVEREEYPKAVKLLEQSLDVEKNANVERYLEQVRRLMD